jgi:hypothetical protein
MREELDKKLCEKYPKIFRDRNSPMTHTAMCWGFDHGDGWYNIIDGLCAVIENHIWNNQRHVESATKDLKYREMAAAGNWSFLDNLYGESTKDWLAKDDNLEQTKQQYLRKPSNWTQNVKTVPEVVATQVKEKYGTLRFYYNGGDEYISGAVSMAEYMSARTCEVCGSAGKTLGGGWIRTLCKTHAEEIGYSWDQEVE